jgi:transposase
MIADEGLTRSPRQRKLHRLVRSFDSWHDELLAYLDTGGVSNGPTEAVNG